MSTEIPIWVNGKIRWLSGIDKKTTCKDVVEALLEEEGIDKSEGKDFAIMERWRKVERPLDETSKILKIWSHWGSEKKEVRLCLRRIDNEVDSGRGSPTGNTFSIRKKRHRTRGNRKTPWTIHPETVHPRRLAELGRIVKKEYDDYYHIKSKLGEDNNNYGILNDTNGSNNIYCDYKDNDNIYNVENIYSKEKTGHKSYHCSGTGRLHSTLLSNSENHFKKIPKCCSKRESKQKVRNSENIEKLMKLILAQGATIQSQLQRLKEREEQIESLEHERHRERVEKNGRNYLLETYLGSLKDAEIPDEMNKGNGYEGHADRERSQIITTKKKITEIVKPNETESNSEKSNKIYEEKLEHLSDDGNNESSVQHQASKLLQKGTRSKSESRTYECKLNRNLKRTLSDNTIAESSDAVINNNYDKNENSNTELDETQNTKESEEVIELRKIQSQIEIWEKVFKINKKLEKEEENLVRLHIKIKKFQSENYRLTKEKYETNEKENKEDIVPCSNDLELLEKETKYPKTTNQENDCEELQKNLAMLRSDLEQNSKEIYQNFTKLIEEDEEVEQKRSCLSKLMSDLEITNHEHHMLNEMITKKEKQNSVQNLTTSFCTYSNEIEDENNFQDFSHSLHIRTEENSFLPTEIPLSSDKNMCSNIKILPEVNNFFNQRTEKNLEQNESKPMKPKTVKICFKDQIQNQEKSETGEEEFHKESTGASGALKSILKNKKYIFNKDFERCNINESQPLQNFTQGCALNNDKLKAQHKDFNVNSYIQIQNDNPSYLSNQIGYDYPFQVSYSIYNHFPNETIQNEYRQPPMTNFSEDLKNVYPTRNSHSSCVSKTSTNGFSQSTMVTTRALIHNDTDSSTSSDTSGLSSMYSSSPTVEEPYVEQAYVLDTLV